MKKIALALSLLAALATQAQTVYRCGADGRSYSDSPCKDGRAVDVNDPRSAEDTRAAADAARREQQLADSLRRERLAREAEGSRRSVVALGPATAEPERLVAKGKKKNAAPPRKRQRITPGPQRPGRASAAQPPAASTSPSAARAFPQTPG